MTRVATLLVAMLACVPIAAIDTELAFDDPELQARYENLIAEVRCVTCQNQNIKDSNAFIAADLRREIRRLIGEGKSDVEVTAFLVERYGDFVLYSPRKSGGMVTVWIVPFILLLLGAFAAIRVTRHRMALPVEDDEGAPE